MIMFTEKKLFLQAAAAIVIMIFVSASPADTWQLGSDGQLKPAEQTDEFIKAVGEIKRLSAEGQLEQLKQAFEGLKTNFPEIAGPELDAFIEAEMLLCEGKLEASYRAFERFLNRFSEGRFYEAALDREFAIGTAYLQGRRKKVLKFVKIRGYAEGEKIMEGIADRAGDSIIAQQSLIAVALAYENRRKFEPAYEQWLAVSDRWPAGQIAEDALLGMARCKHAAYRGPKYDSSSLGIAKSCYERFKLMYPEDANSLEIDDRLALIEEQLAYKKFQTAQYYQRTSTVVSDANQVNPADFYYVIVLKNWPQSTAAKMAAAAMQVGESIEEKVQE